jgi:energy-coupling factor transporter ATP-binding protein EcfA2
VAELECCVQGYVLLVTEPQTQRSRKLRRNPMIVIFDANHVTHLDSAAPTNPTMGNTFMARSNHLASTTLVRINFRPLGNGPVTDHITQFRIKNFRSCTDVALDGLGDITAFVGRNGVGKTNILKAIEAAARSVTSPTMSFPRRPSSMEVHFSIKGKSYLYERSIKVKVTQTPDRKRRDLILNESVMLLNRNEWKRLILRDDETLTVDGHEKSIQIASQVPCLQAVLAFFPHTSPLVKHAAKILSFFEGVKYFPLDEISEPNDQFDALPVITDKAYQAWAATLNSPSCSLDSVCLQLLHLWITDKPTLQELQDILGNSGIRLIDEILVRPLTVVREKEDAPAKPEDTLYHLSFKMSDSLGASSGISYQFSHLSVGTRRIIRLLVCVLTGRSTVALIEHPEDAIHSGMVKKLMDVLRVNSDRRQMLIASHSPQVFNILTPQQIRLVWMKSGATAVRSLTETELTAAANFICNDGPLSEYLESIQET